MLNAIAVLDPLMIPFTFTASSKDPKFWKGYPAMWTYHWTSNYIWINIVHQIVRVIAILFVLRAWFLNGISRWTAIFILVERKSSGLILKSPCGESPPPPLSGPRRFVAGSIFKGRSERKRAMWKNAGANILYMFILILAFLYICGRLLGGGA